MVVRKWGLVLIGVGALMLAFVLLATPLHIYGTGFGSKHILGVIVCIVVLIAGLVLALFPREKS